jgi:NIMA (never in mitosis gene a)-related kinase
MGFMDSLEAMFQQLRTKPKSQPSSKDKCNAPPKAPEWKPNDRYRILKKFEEGDEGRCAVVRSISTGDVYVAKHIRSNPKQESGSVRADAGRRRPLPNEVRMLIRLQNHLNIIQFFNSEPHGSELHLLYLEFCSGGDLLEQLRKWKNLDLRTLPGFTLHALVSLTQALAFVHHGVRYAGDDAYSRTRQGHEPIIHGDLKPDNIFLRWPGSECGMPDIVLADFGMACYESESRGITGTPGYDSPEVRAIADLRDADPDAYEAAKKKKVITTKSDVYQLGLVIHLLATGKHFTVGSEPALIELPPEHRFIVGMLPFLIWCLQVEPIDRLQCTVHEEEGIMEAVNIFRTKRDAIFKMACSRKRACGTC